MAAKVFEVEDVLPATTQLRISWVNNILNIPKESWIYSNNGSLKIVARIYNGDIYIRDSVEGTGFKIYDDAIDDFISPYTNYNGNHPYCDIDTSTWDINYRTIFSIGTGMDGVFTWEDLNASSGYSITFEENGGSTVTDLTEQTALPSPLPTTTKANHVFAGWYYDNLFTQKANAGDELTANVTLYAKWYTPTTWCEDIADAIREKDGTTKPIKHLDFPERILAISGGGDAPSTGSQSIFTGATVPLTYKDNTHDYENNYEYKSNSHNITITGLDGRATITGNGTKSVLVAFDVTSSTSSLKNFTITCVNGEQTLEYKGLHAHYGETVTGILTFAYTNITPDGSEGTIDTNYKFISTSSTDSPLFESNTTLWNTVYSYQILNVLVGNYSSSSIGNYFLSYCYSFNQPLTLPNNQTSIGTYFLNSCRAFNQPLTLPSNLSSIGTYFLSYCNSFNQPLTLPSNLSSIGTYFLDECYSFNQPLTLPSNLSSIGTYFLYNCYSFNQPLTLPSNLSSIEEGFLYNCYSFNQPLTLPNNQTSIGTYFLNSCRAFNQPLTLPSNLSSIGEGFLRYCYSFNQPLTLPSNLSSIGTYFLRDCNSFNQPLTLPSNLSSIGTYFLYNCYSFNQPLTLPSNLSSIGSYFLSYCNSFNQPLTLPSNLSSIGTYFLYNCYSLSVIVYNASVYPTDGNSLSQTTNSKTSSSGAGIIVYGTKRAELMSALANRTSSPYRKLINGGS